MGVYGNIHGAFNGLGKPSIKLEFEDNDELLAVISVGEEEAVDSEILADEVLQLPEFQIFQLDAFLDSTSRVEFFKHFSFVLSYV